MDQYAVFGNPVAQSQSPVIHQQFAMQTQQSMRYDKQLVEPDAFSSAATNFFQSGKGLNITAPFKLDAYAFADQLSARARVAGAVNTLIKQDDGQIIGDNTDGVGLVADLKNNLSWPIKDKRILIIGAGGAVRGVLKPLLDEKPREILIYNRSAEKAQSLATAFSAFGICKCITEAQLNALLEQSGKSTQHMDLIINGTSASLSNELPALPALILNQLVNGAFCYDMVYAKTPTFFLQHCARYGAQSIADGLGMLVEQAAESFYLWRNVRPQTQSVIDHLRRNL